VRNLSYVGRRRPVGELLIEAELITRDQLQYALELQGGNGTKLGDILVKEGLVSPQDLASVLSLQLNIPFVELKRYLIQPEALKLVPETLARKYTVLPLTIEEDGLLMVMADPENLQAIEDLQARTRMRIKPALSTLSEIKEALDQNYRAVAEIEKQLSHIPGIEELIEAEPRVSPAAVAEAPIVRALDLLITQAIRDRASDIHIEPQEDRLRIRNRIDGILHDSMSLPLSVHPPLISRIKILANMNIADRRRPQDGQFSFQAGKNTVDIRVASSDTVHGEMMVLRLLDKSFAVLDLARLGFMPESYQLFLKMLRAPHGMLLVSGPTGSGKTTTLYAAINQMDKQENKVITIEDPVEYRFADITQIPINPRAGVTFANGLRAILRLDPDVILVGEIRDSETAQIAIQAALTGHLVLSSIHANDSIGVLFRLLDLGVEPFLITSALVGIVSQRMVRHICPNCRTLGKRPVDEVLAYKEEMGEERTEFHSGTGCNYCAQTGYRGRTGVFEILVMSEAIRRKLLTNESADGLYAQALKENMATMRRDGMLKVKEGITTPYEVIRNVFSLAH